METEVLRSKYLNMVANPNNFLALVEFSDCLKKTPLKEILANSNLLFAEDKLCVDLLIKIYNTFSLTMDEVIDQRERLVQFIEYCDSTCKLNEQSEHRQKLIEAVGILNKQIELENQELIKQVNDRVEILEGLMDVGTLEIEPETQETVDSIDSMILQLDDSSVTKANLDDICNKLYNSSDNDFINSLNTIIPRAFTVSLWASNSNLEDKEDISTKLPETIVSKLNDMEYVDGTVLSVILQRIEAEVIKLSNKFDDMGAIEIVNEIFKKLNNLMESNNKISTKLQDLEVKGLYEFYNIINGQDVQLEHSLNNLCALSYMYNEILVENKVEHALIRGANKAEHGVTKVVHTSMGAGGSVRNVATAVAKIPSSLDNEISNFINKLIETDKKNRRERLINKGVRVRLFKFIRNSLTTGITAALFGPVVATIGLIGKIAVDEYLDEKERREILREFEQELKIIDEKIDDAKSQGDNKQKYELMRLKDRLEKEHVRVKYYLDK